MTESFNRNSKREDLPYCKVTIRQKVEKDVEERNLRFSILDKLKSRTKYELMYEAFYIANLFYYMNETEKHTRDTVFYIISTSWFNRWKRYVNFDYFMSNTDKFLKMNTLPYRDASDENFIHSLDNQVKTELHKFFDNFFLTNNGENYPGAVSNKDLIYEKGTYYVNFDKPKSSINYNLIDSVENGNDYFIITSDIWRIFKAIYGGKEIKRYKVPSIEKQVNEIFIETKLKVINLVLIKPKTDFIKVEKPKMIFISHKAPLYELKNQLRNIFSFLKHIDKKDMRLWILDPKFTHELFDVYIKEKHKEESRIIFPGFCLDLFKDDVELGDIDDMISEKIIVLEYIEYQHSHFLFKSQHLNDFSQEFQSDIKQVSRGKKKLANNEALFYDKIFFHHTSYKGDKNSLFTIKKFFKEKYQLSHLNELEANVVLKNMNNNDRSNNYELYKEVEILKENMDLIFDKNELLNKFSYAYSNSLKAIDTGMSMMSQENNKNEGILDTRSRQDMILKKRERTKLFEQIGKKTRDKEIVKKKQINVDCEDYSSNCPGVNDISIEEEQWFKEEEEEDKCCYCNKILEGEFSECTQCNKVKYCNSLCLNKDLRFHNKTCILK